MPSLKHIHTYGRWRKRGDEMMFKCLDPSCTHTIPRSLMIGKQGKCSKCDAMVLMDWRQAERAKTLCLNCQETKEGRLFRARKSMSEDLMDIALPGLLKGTFKDLDDGIDLNEEGSGL